MTSTLVNAQYFDSSHESLKKKALAAVLPFTGSVKQADVKANRLTLSAHVSNADSQDRKLADFLVIGTLSVLLHVMLYQNIDPSDFHAELIEPEKPVNKVEISIVRPQPKPVAPPPKAMPKPVQKKVVPLKKPKEKPKSVEPVQEVSPVAEPVLDAPPAPPAPGPVEKIIPPRGGAGYLNNPPPVYPDIAMDRGWQGRVLLKVLVKANGKPKTVSVLKTSGKQVLDKEAIRTVKKWTFMPAKRGATPIDGWVTVPISFKLR